MAKKKKTIDIDILDMEFQNDLPHWLHPLERGDDSQFNEVRRERQKERTNKIMEKGRKSKGRRARDDDEEDDDE